jgi:hypothetical protein
MKSLLNGHRSLSAQEVTEAMMVSLMEVTGERPVQMFSALVGLLAEISDSRRELLLRWCRVN